MTETPRGSQPIQSPEEGVPEGGPIPLHHILYALPSPFGGMPVPAKEGYAVYSTYDKVVGLVRLPFDGNPSQVRADLG